ncbi:unnamed protein product [Prunus armeniaca]
MALPQHMVEPPIMASQPTTAQSWNKQINLVKDLGPGSYGEERMMDRRTSRQVERSQASRVGTSMQEEGHEHVAEHAGVS